MNFGKLAARLCLRWSRLTFETHSEQFTHHTRVLRLLEEVTELAQAERVSIQDASTILVQVYNRPVGEPEKELGGVMVCLAAYAGTRGYDFEEIFWREFERIMDPKMMEKVRKRNLEGDKIGFNTTPDFLSRIPPLQRIEGILINSPEWRKIRQTNYSCLMEADFKALSDKTPWEQVEQCSKWLALLNTYPIQCGGKIAG